MRLSGILAAAALLCLPATGMSQLVITKVSTRGSDNGAAKEYVVLANHGTSAVNLANYRLRRKSGAGGNNDMTISAGSIPAKSHFLLASNTYGSGAGAVEGSTADYVDSNVSGLTGGLSDTATGVSIALLDSALNQLDAVSYTNGGTAVPTIHEGTAFAGTLNGVGQTSILQRKRAATPGPYTDTNNNNSDLEISTAKASPENSTIVNVPVSVSAFSID